jgi:hypothetical protein
MMRSMRCTRAHSLSHALERLRYSIDRRGHRISGLALGELNRIDLQHLEQAP